MATPGKRRRSKLRGWLRHSRSRKYFVRTRYAEMVSKQPLVCCPLCGMPMHITEVSIDHIVPISKGGTNDRSNLQLTHVWCNLEKGDKT